MQKLAYFTSLGLNIGLGHRAHFFGPYSSKVEDAVSNAVIAGEIHETVERMPHWSGGPDVLKYTYELTENGRTRVERLVKQHRQEWNSVRESVDAIQTVLPNLDQKTLSSAAKTYLIISESEEGVDEAEIPALAKRLGWDLNGDQVRDTVMLLERLNLLVDAGDDVVVDLPQPL
jgi:uncharacterized protein YwgA